MNPLLSSSSRATMHEGSFSSISSDPQLTQMTGSTQSTGNAIQAVHLNAPQATKRVDLEKITVVCLLILGAGLMIAGVVGISSGLAAVIGLPLFLSGMALLGCTLAYAASIGPSLNPSVQSS